MSGETAAAPRRRRGSVVRWVGGSILVLGGIALCVAVEGAPPHLPDRADILLPEPMGRWSVVRSNASMTLKMGQGVVTLRDASQSRDQQVEAYWSTTDDHVVTVTLTRTTPWWRVLLDGKWPWGGGARQWSLVAIYSGNCATGSSLVTDAKQVGWGDDAP